MSYEEHDGNRRLWVLSNLYLRPIVLGVYEKVQGFAKSVKKSVWIWLKRSLNMVNDYNENKVFCSSRTHSSSSWWCMLVALQSYRDSKNAWESVPQKIIRSLDTANWWWWCDVLFHWWEESGKSLRAQQVPSSRMSIMERSPCEPHWMLDQCTQ